MWRARQACQLRCIANGAGRLSNPAIAPSKQGVTKGWDKFLSVSWYPQPHKHHSKPKSKAGPYKLHPKFPKILFRPGRLRIYCRSSKIKRCEEQRWRLVGLLLLVASRAAGDKLEVTVTGGSSSRACAVR